MFAASKTASVSGGYQISRSLRFNSADSAYLNRTPATTTNRTTWTWSGWVKRGKLGVYGRVFQAREGSTGNQFFLRFNNTDTIFVTGDSGSYTLETTQVFRDPSAWYHIVFACDTTQATSSNRFKLYVNGSQVTAFGTATYPSQNLNTTVNSAFPHGIGAETSGPSEFYDGYITETYLIDGQALTPSSFGETNAQTGVWQPKAYSGSYGTNGFYLNFSDNSNTTSATLGKDYSGNGNNWTPNNFSVTAGAGNDSLVDSPTSYGTDTGVGGTVRGNYCTYNPLDKYTITDSNFATFTNGNLEVTRSNQSWSSGRSTMAMSSGKWYAEMTVTASTAGGFQAMFGICAPNFIISDYFGGASSGYGYNAANGQKYNGGTGVSYGATWSTNDVIGIAFDADAGTLSFYKNGVSQGTAYTGLSGTFCFAISLFPQTSGSMTATGNFGQRPFAYTAPTGFKALCTQNLPTPTIGATTATLANQYFTPVLYTGNGSTQSVTGVGFQPDWTWIKIRSSIADHALYDAVRGVQKQLESSTTDAETTETTGLTAFGSDGFTVGSLAQANGSGSTYVAWNWKANGSGSTNTAGTVTSTVSASTTSGFSVVTFTSPASGAFTVGHGLGVAPAFVITKLRNAANNWNSYHVSLGNSASINLNRTDAVATGSTNWNSTSPTSTVFSFGSGFAGSYPIVIYCFAEVAGYSKIGSFVGNGSVDGPFVYCGFRPKYIMFKASSIDQAWGVVDTTRSPYNLANLNISPNYSSAENSGYAKMDILSNGFKIRETDTFINSSGATYIFMAFAENPFKYSIAR